MSGERGIAVAALFVALAFGTAVRLVDLGANELHEDELDHVFAAKSLEETGEPLLPSGNAYTRALEFTRMVAVVTGGDTSSEARPRLPAAAFGIASLLALAAFAWRVGGPWTAVWTAVLLAIYPDAVGQSRIVRFYTLQLLILIGAMVSTWAAVGARPDGRVARRWGWIAVTLVAFGLALHIQVTTVSVVAGWWLALAVLGTMDALGPSKASLRHNVCLQVAGLLAAGSLAGLALRPGLARNAWEMSQMLPAWLVRPGSPLTYYRYFSDHLPLVVSLSPLILLAAARRNVRLAVLCTAWFVVPFVLHSAVFPFKGQRFLLGAIPGLLLLTAEAATVGFGALRRGLAGMVTSGTGSAARAARWSGAGVGLVATVLVVTTPAFNAARKLPSGKAPLGWRMAALVVDSASPGNDLPVGTSFTLPALRYLPRADFTFAANYHNAGREGGAPAAVVDGTIRDFYGGLPVLVEVDEILDAHPEASRALIVVGEVHFQGWDTHPELRERILVDGRELCRGRCVGLRVYEWDLDATRRDRGGRP